MCVYSRNVCISLKTFLNTVCFIVSLAFADCKMNSLDPEANKMYFKFKEGSRYCKEKKHKSNGVAGGGGGVESLTFQSEKGRTQCVRLNL